MEPETEIMTMSQKELNRLKIIERIERKELTQKAAAKLLKLKTRQVRRLQRAYNAHGTAGLLSKRRGRLSTNRLSDELRQQVIDIICERYHDFGPTLAHEKLTEVHELSLSVESVRQIMMSAGIWKGKKRKTGVAHQLRERRPCFGELIQLDGSPHAWFEDRGSKCCLLVLIDDATSQLVGLRFEPVECTQGYFMLIKDYLKQYGRPLALYSDKHGIFRVNIKEARTGDGNTQYKRAMRELEIESICANTAQAKGRVERVNQTLQDRLIKELRLQGISDIDSANTFLPQFIEDFNKRFAVQPKSLVNCHRTTIPNDEALDLILSEQHSRTLSKNLEISFENKTYQIEAPGRVYRMRHGKVTVCVDYHGEVKILHKGKLLKYKVYEKQEKLTIVATDKEINQVVDEIKNQVKKVHRPKANHPWRKYSVVNKGALAPSA